MDINEIRLKNYKLLRKKFIQEGVDNGEPERGAIKRLAIKTGVSAAYLSHISNRIKNIGDNTARALEESFNLPHGWLDVDHASGNDPESSSERQYVALALDMFRRNPLLAQTELIKMARVMLDADKKGKKDDENDD